jgi:peptide-methionine (R)-S-oxide reductase
MKRRHLLASLAAWPLAAAGVGRAMAAGTDGTAGRRSIAQMQQDWRQFLAKGADVTESTAPLAKSEAEWKSSLPEQQFYVLRKEGTERPFTSPLNDEKRRGLFVCAGCALPHFTSEMKFDSGTGWPSFWAPIDGAIRTTSDRSLFMTRTETHCRRCGGHLGHVFDDGPKPTGLRYCMNGAALKFLPD